MEQLLITLDFDSDTPLYQQIYESFVAEIKAGTLRAGTKAPSKRALCQTLGVSQNTVETAYGILCAEGYLHPRARSGFYVAPVEPLPASPLPPPAPAAGTPAEPSWRWNFSTSAVDTEIFPYASWAKLTKEVLSQRPELLQRGDRQGDPELREALAAFLRETRGVRCAPRQIVLGAGVEVLLEQLVKLFPPATVFGLENPGYATPYRIIRGNGRRIDPLALDSQGVNPECLRQSGAQVVYVTPSHQFPLGMTMPAGRRAALLRWAALEPGRYLVEDDYDSEFRFTSRPIPAMQGLDQVGRVVYVGTFSRTIAPSIRAAYLVLPPELLKRYREGFHYASATVSRFEQQTLTRFLSQGLYARHLRRAGNAYRTRQAELLRLLREIPGAAVSGAEAGLHFLLTVPGLSERELLARAASVGARMHGLSEYVHGGVCRPSTLVVGFAGLRAEEIGEAVEALRRAWGV